MTSLFNKLQPQYVDLPEVRETFIDSLGPAFFDGTQVRMELQITRMDTPQPPKPPVSRRYPAARIVMTPQSAIELFNQLGGFMQVMKMQGLVKDKPSVKGVPN